MENRKTQIASHLPSLRKYAAVLMRNPADADDLVQECLCRAIERIRPWHRIKDLRAYLFTILHNVYVDRVARSRNDQNIVSDELVGRNLVVKPAQFHRVEIRDLSRALALLRPEHRQILLLIGVEGMSYKSAAALIGVPVGTVMSRLHRARETLREMMEGAREGEMHERSIGNGARRARSAGE